MPNSLKGLTEIRGDMPTFHDAELDAALNEFVIKFVDSLEEGIGESRGTVALLEHMKEHLVTAVVEASAEALSFSGFRGNLRWHPGLAVLPRSRGES